MHGKGGDPAQDAAPTSFLRPAPVKLQGFGAPHAANELPAAKGALCFQSTRALDVQSIKYLPGLGVTIPRQN